MRTIDAIGEAIAAAIIVVGGMIAIGGALLIDALPIL